MKRPKIILILTISILVGFIIGYFCISNHLEQKTKKTDIKSVKQELKNSPKIKTPTKYTKQLDKSLKKNGFIEDKICGMSVNGSNRSFVNNDNMHIHMYILNSNYYKNINKALNNEYKRVCKGKLDEKCNFQFSKKQKDAFIYCYGNKYSALEKEEYSRQIVVKLRPNIVMTLSSIKFIESNNNKANKKEYYSYISHLKEDISLLNKIFHDAEKEKNYIG